MPHSSSSQAARFDVRVQVLTSVGVLDRGKQLGVARELTDIVAAAANDPALAYRTWVLITEWPEGGWGINGHANTSADIVAAVRAELAKPGSVKRSGIIRMEEFLVKRKGAT